MARGACALAALPITAALAPISAEAQSVDTAFGRAEIAEDISIADIDDLYFGQIVPRTNPGTVVLTPGATATCTTTGGLVRSGPCQAAVFEGQASSGATLRIIRPGGNSITITNPGGATMQVRNFTFLEPGAGNLYRHLHDPPAVQLSAAGLRESRLPAKRRRDEQSG